MATPLLSHPQALRVIAPVVVGLVFLGLWQWACVAFEVPVYLVPTPLKVAQTLAANWASLLGALAVTMKITLLAFGASIVVGVLFAFLLVQSRIVEASLFPYAILLQVTPIVAIAPLIIIWVKEPTPALVLCAVLVALFPIISNTVLGLRSVNPGLLNLFRLNRATRWQTLLRLRIPSALPYFFAGLRISSGLSLIGAVVAEFVAGTGGTSAGLAYQILQAGFQLDIPLMFAALFLIALAGVALFLAMAWISRLALRGWHESELG
ncbi:ABC transporter permease [Derxia lacustris]|uniref:ABC transporter permease n=1 Tax=Derxia lacustris TaxID=764842 RepID=UPI000A177C9D|nr:ABC transporter permease [Derxia lacustris]